MAAATLTQATCEVIGKEKEGQYGPYRPVLFQLPNGEQKWKSYKPEAPELNWLRKGETYSAVIMGDEFKLIDPNTAPSAPATAPTTAPAPPAPAQQGTITALDPATKQAIAAYVQDLAALYAYCYQQAKVQLEPHGASEETARCAASSLFISASKKFQLDR